MTGLRYHICPRCKANTNKYHLMMVECDKCINDLFQKHSQIPDKYVKNLSGLLILNPKWLDYHNARNG